MTSTKCQDVSYPLTAIALFCLPAHFSPFQHFLTHGPYSADIIYGRNPLPLPFSFQVDRLFPYIGEHIKIPKTEEALLVFVFAARFKIHVQGLPDNMTPLPLGIDKSVILTLWWLIMWFFSIWGFPKLSYTVQGSAKEWFLGCVNPASGLPLAVGREFTQPRD